MLISDSSGIVKPRLDVDAVAGAGAGAAGAGGAAAAGAAGAAAAAAGAGAALDTGIVDVRRLRKLCLHVGHVLFMRNH